MIPSTTRFLLLHVLALAAACLSAASASAQSDAGCGRVTNGTPSATTFSWSAQAGAEQPSVAPRYKIAVWGDSLTSSRDFVDAALETAGIAKSAVLPAFIQAGIKTPGLQLPLRASCASQGWQVDYAHKKKRKLAGYAKGFVKMRSNTPGDLVYLDFRYPAATTRVRELTIQYEKPKVDSSLLLAVAINDGQEKLVSLSRATGTSLQIRPDRPMATMRLRLVSGAITLHGFAPVYEEAADVVLDTLSIPGGSLRSWGNADPALMPGASIENHEQPYSLILVQYGTNEGADASFSSDSYRQYLHTHLKSLRGYYPRARCVLIGPPDRGVVGATAPPASLKYAFIHQQIALAQKDIGRQYRCEFWDWQAAMGGPGSAAAWSRMNPPQMQADLTHLSATGYRLSGKLLGAYLNLNKQ
ncbi:MAG: hypothetical protein ACJ8HI_12005 [Massilia sp.]